MQCRVEGRETNRKREGGIKVGKSVKERHGDSGGEL